MATRQVAQEVVEAGVSPLTMSKSSTVSPMPTNDVPAEQSQHDEQPDEDDADWESLFKLSLPGSTSGVAPLFAHQVASPEWAMPFLDKDLQAPTPVFEVTLTPMWRTKLVIKNPSIGTPEARTAALSSISDSIAMPLGEKEATLEDAVFAQWAAEDSAMAAAPQGDYLGELVSARRTENQVS
jgi:hypothetical protein